MYCVFNDEHLKKQNRKAKDRKGSKLTILTVFYKQGFGQMSLRVLAVDAEEVCPEQDEPGVLELFLTIQKL